MYVTRKCRNCGCVLEAFERDYIALGPPFVDCPKCGTTVLLSHIQEWNLKSFLSKVYFIFVHCYTCLFWSLLGPLLIWGAIYLLGLWREFPDYIFGVITLLSYLVTLIAVSAMRTSSLVKEIKQSQERMQDREYLEKLRRLGLLNDE